MLPFDTLIYLLIIIVCVLSEYSLKVNTSNVGNKTGLALMVVGSIMEVANVHNPFIPIGVLVYFGRNVLKAYLNRQKRRATDGNSNQRTIR